MKDINGKIQYKDEEYTFVFNLNVMEAIQEEYGTIDKWAELTDGNNGEPDANDGNNGEPNAKALIFGMTEMLNEGILISNEDNGENRKLLTKRQVGRMLTDIGLQSVTKVMNKTIVESTKGEEKNA